MSVEPIPLPRATALVNVHEAKTHLSRLLERVEAGERIVIARSGRPIADLVPHVPQQLRFGLLAGRVENWDPDAFNAPDPDVASLFEGG